MTHYHIVATDDQGGTRYFYESGGGPYCPTDHLPLVISDATWHTLSEARKVLAAVRREFKKEMNFVMTEPDAECLLEWRGLLNQLSLASLRIVRTVTVHEELRGSKWIQTKLKRAE